MIQAIKDAMRVELQRDPNVVIFGEDVGKVGGVFRATEGLQGEFGEERVFDTPLAESAIGGMLSGWRFKASVRLWKFNSSALFSKRSTKSRCKRHGCVTVPAAVTRLRSRFERLSAAA